MKILFRLLLILIMIVSGCSGEKNPTRHNDFTPLTSIEIKVIPATTRLAIGTSIRLSAVGNFSDQFTRDISDEVVWASADPTTVAFVTGGGSGRVRGLAPGSAILTASKGAVTAHYTLTISSATITGLTISPTTPSVAKGLTAQFIASGSFSDATTQDLTFDASWTSIDPTVATVSDALLSKGLAQALAAGSTTISASFNGASTSTTLTVTVPVLQSIAVTSSTPSALSLSSASFKATGTYTDGSTVDITSLPTTIWSSSQSGVATINSTGTAKTVSQGTSSISATVGSISGTMNFNVTGGNLTGITLSVPTNTTLVKDTSIRMTATGTFSNGSTIISRDISGAVDWTVADTTKAVITVAGTNLVWLKASEVTFPAVPTTVTATSGSVTGTTSLTVTNPSPLSIAMSPATLDLYTGTGDRFILVASFNDGSTQDITADSNWSSNDTAKATVSDSGSTKGRVSGVAAGSTTISATYGSLTAVKNSVTVSARTITTLTIAGSTSMTSGNQIKFTANAGYSDGTSKDVTEDASWSLDKTNVAILTDAINQPGQIVAIDSGSATLTATFSGKSAIATVTVP
jgi:hypothetical protein